MIEWKSIDAEPPPLGEFILAYVKPDAKECELYEAMGWHPPKGKHLIAHKVRNEPRYQVRCAIRANTYDATHWAPLPTPPSIKLTKE
jgi:hypothetical protein